MNPTIAASNPVCIQCGAPINGPPGLPCAAYPAFAMRHNRRKKETAT